MKIMLINFIIDILVKFKFLLKFLKLIVMKYDIDSNVNILNNVRK